MINGNVNNGGGLLATTPFKHVIYADLEFQIKNGNRPWPVCMVVHESLTGQTKRYWRDELVSMKEAPFETGNDAVMVAYAAQAELSCFLTLGWKLPVNVLDLFAEYRVETNGQRLHASLLNALASYGLAHIDAGEKEAMRELVLRGGWSRSEQEAILKYCESDVGALVALLPAMSPAIDWPRALLRGRYTAAVARMEHTGVPIDARLLRAVDQQWRTVKKQLVAEVDQGYGVYHGLIFKTDRFSRWLRRNNIPWPRLQSDLLDLSDDTFKFQEQAWPILGPLRQLRQSLGQIRFDGLRIGYDGRTRTSLRPFGSITGRNQPSTTKFAFGPAKWTRGFIRPPEGYGIAYIDFSSQEIGLAAGLSQDERLIAAYNDDDPYIAFAKDAKLVPGDATKDSHPVIRDRCKAVVLGQNYGMGAPSIALQAGITPAEARELIGLHKRTYRTFWRWSGETVSSALLSLKMQTIYGWKRQVTSRDKITSLMNFPMQANGAEMMRIAAIGATEAGIDVCAPVHDAFLIAAPLDRLDDDTARMQAIMTQAGISVAALPIKTEAKVFRFPDRYMEDRGIEMWNRVVRLVGAPQEQL
jgi:DNA polymerase I